MLLETIKNIIANELLNPGIEMTRQFQKILEVKYENGTPKINSIKIDEDANEAVAYVNVKDESFYLIFYFDISSEVELTFVDTVPYVGISFSPTSEELSIEELLGLTTIIPNSIIKKGDLSSNKRYTYNYNRLDFDASSEPGHFESKLVSFLTILETDPNGIKELIKQTDCKHLFVTIVYHIGTTNFTGLDVNSEIIQRLSLLGLGLTFDLYATGNKFIDS